jgi:small subunit ribosomal protein S16
MAVRIRLARYGRTHRPFYRVVAIDSREQREGRACEILGTYNPLLADKNISVEIERVHAWVRQGARLNPSVEGLLKKFGYEPYPSDIVESRDKQVAKRKERWAKRQKKDGKAWVKPSQRALNQHKLALKHARKAENEKALEAHRAAKAAAEPAPEEAESSDS